ncbi:MAG: hypothetical protein GXP62_17615 [Oligoflexia bacterium]|nr:hypothetical protein [Oligoflexia bacterium]
MISLPCACLSAALLLGGCAKADPQASTIAPSPTKPVNSVPDHDSDLVDTLLSWRELSRTALLQHLHIDEDAVQHGLSYGPSAGLDMVTAPTVSPARFYLTGDQLVMIQVSGPALEDVDPDALLQRFPPQIAVSSRAGKTFEHQVCASQGIAWSDDGERVAFVEIFPPTSVEDWKRRFYAEPGPFIK